MTVLIHMFYKSFFRKVRGLAIRFSMARGRRLFWGGSGWVKGTSGEVSVGGVKDREGQKTWDTAAFVDGGPPLDLGTSPPHSGDDSSSRGRGGGSELLCAECFVVCASFCEHRLAYLQASSCLCKHRLAFASIVSPDFFSLPQHPALEYENQQELPGVILDDAGQSSLESAPGQCRKWGLAFVPESCSTLSCSQKED